MKPNRLLQEFELSNILVDIACKIINYRLDHNMTQKDLADKLDITQEAVLKLESGEYNPSIEFLFKISKKLDWRFGLIFGDQHCVYENECNIDDYEDSKPLAQRPKYEEIE